MPDVGRDPERIQNHDSGDRSPVKGGCHQSRRMAHGVPDAFVSRPSPVNSSQGARRWLRDRRSPRRSDAQTEPQPTSACEAPPPSRHQGGPGPPPDRRPATRIEPGVLRRRHHRSRWPGQRRQRRSTATPLLGEVLRRLPESDPTASVTLDAIEHLRQHRSLRQLLQLSGKTLLERLPTLRRPTLMRGVDRPPRGCPVPTHSPCFLVLAPIDLAQRPVGRLGGPFQSRG